MATPSSIGDRASGTATSRGLSRPGDGPLLAALEAADVATAARLLAATAPEQAARVKARLASPTPGDRLATAFQQVLPPAERQQLLEVLSRVIAEHRLGTRLAVAVAPGNLHVVRAATTGDPELVATGTDAARWFVEHLGKGVRIAVESSYGTVDLIPGAIWGGRKMLILADTMTVHYADGSNIYRQTTSEFIRNEWFRAFATAARNASTMVFLVKVEVELLLGLAVPFEVLVAVGFAKYGLFIHNHRNLLIELWANADRFLETWRVFGRLCPFTRRVIDRELWGQFWGAARGAAFNAEDTAFILGRWIRGGLALTTFTAALVLKMAAKVVVLVTLSHGVGILGRALSERARDLNEAFRHKPDLQAAFAAAHFRVTAAELGTVLMELYGASTQHREAFTTTIAQLALRGDQLATSMHRVAERWERMTE